ncbi:MAG: hypothetical protein M0Z80_01995 [Treponema sp.]|nr:hypothetical protein [Treponema sp.]
MQAVGPIEARLIVSGAGPGIRLRAGAVVSVDVLERLEPGLFRVAVGGLVLKARAQSALVPGSVFQARVAREGNVFVLQALGGREDALRALLLSAGLPDDALSRLALAALLREGVAPEPRAAMRVRRAAAEARDELDAADRRAVAARLEAKGLAAESSFVDAASARGGDYRGGGRDGGQRGKGGPGGEEREGAAGAKNRVEAPASPGAGTLDPETSPDTPAFDLEGGFERLLPPEKLPSALASLLRSLTLRSGGEGDLLSLFNHLRGPEGSWIHVPFAFDLDSIAFSGSFRIKLPYAFGGPGRMEARFETSRRGEEGKREWRLSLGFGGGRHPELRLAVDDADSLAAARRLLAGLEEELSAFECSVSFADPYEEMEAGGLDVDA